MSSAEVSCDPQEISARVLDLDPLGASGSPLPLYQYCLSVDQLPYALESLPAGLYEVLGCAVMSASAIERALSAASDGTLENTWGECVTPQYWRAALEVGVSLSATQPIELRLTPRCACD